MRSRIWERARWAFGAGDRVLDRGCGTGEDAIRLARDGVRVVATDASGDMVEVEIERIGVLTNRVVADGQEELP